MATQRITVSVPAEIAGRLKRAAGRSRSVSEWVTNAVTRALDEEDTKRRFLEFCDGVTTTPEEEKQVQSSFDRITRGGEVRATRAPRRGKTAA